MYIYLYPCIKSTVCNGKMQYIQLWKQVVMIENNSVKEPSDFGSEGTQ